MPDFEICVVSVDEFCTQGFLYLDEWLYDVEALPYQTDWGVRIHEDLLSEVGAEENIFLWLFILPDIWCNIFVIFQRLVH